MKCGKVFPIRNIINGKKIHCQNRKYCFECSPYGKHNTGQLHETNPFAYAGCGEYKCPCGETDPSKFYGHKKNKCGRCHNQYTLKIGQEKRKKAIENLGGKCIVCGYSKYTGAIDFHHIDPLKKDENFKELRGWSQKKIDEEMKKCVPLCKICHAELHAGIINLDDIINK